MPSNFFIRVHSCSFVVLLFLTANKCGWTLIKAKQQMPFSSFHSRSLAFISGSPFNFFNHEYARMNTNKNKTKNAFEFFHSSSFVFISGSPFFTANKRGWTLIKAKQQMPFSSFHWRSLVVSLFFYSMCFVVNLSAWRPRWWPGLGPRRCGVPGG